jgi:hypothetical protein
MSASEQLGRLAALAEEADATSIAEDAHGLLERVREGRFFVACLGQFKRGKSTLINALLGDEVLPSGVAPVTSVVTVVRWSERQARVRIGESEWRDVPVEALGDYISESENPENRNILEQIGRTPLVALERLGAAIAGSTSGCPSRGGAACGSVSTNCSSISPS